MAATTMIAVQCGAKWPKAAAKITEDLDVVLTFYDYPAGHWIHLRTANPFKPTAATLRLHHASPQGLFTLQGVEG